MKRRIFPDTLKREQRTQKGGGGMILQPWQETFNGRTWRDMPGVGADNKKLNFFLFRRGMLDVEDETTCETLADDGITEVAIGAGAVAVKKTRLVSRWVKRFGGAGRKAARKYDTPKEDVRSVGRPATLTPEDQAYRARLRMRLWELRQGHMHAIRTIAEEAGVIYSTLNKFVYEGTGMGTALLEKVSAAAESWASGALPLRQRKKPESPTAVDVPDGCIPYKEWLSIEAGKQGIEPHSLRVQLMRRPQLKPQIVKRNNRCFFVKIQPEDAA